jgi:hypothetical protein
MLTAFTLIKDFSNFKKENWLIFSNYDDEILEILTRDRHRIQIEWETTTKFSFHMLKVSFRYENNPDCGIIKASTSFPIEGNRILLTTEIQLPECLIDRSFYNNNVQLALSESEYKLISLYQRIFRNHKEGAHQNRMHYQHNVVKYDVIEIDNNNNIDYIMRYTYYDTTGLNTAMGVKGYYHTIASTGEDDFEEKLVQMIENKYTLPLLNKKLTDLTDADILVLEMNNT